MILRQEVVSADWSDGMRVAWQLWFRQHGILSGEAVGDQAIEVDTEANTISYVGYDLCEKGHRYPDWPGGGTKAAQSVRVIHMKTTPMPFPGSGDLPEADSCKCRTVMPPWPERNAAE